MKGPEYLRPSPGLRALWAAVALGLAACNGGSTDADGGGSESGDGASSSGAMASAEAPTVTETSAPDDGTASDGAGASETTAASSCVDVIEGDVEIEEDMDLDALRTVRLIEGRLIIRDTQGLQDLSFLECLKEVGSVMVIGGNASLVNLHGLERLERVGFIDVSAGPRFQIVDNPKLESLAGLDGLRFVLALSILDNPELTDLALPSLEHPGSISIGGCRQESEDVPATGVGSNESLTAIVGLDGLRKVDFLTIAGQQNLVSIAHLQALAEAGTEFGDIEIQYNPKLPVADIEAFFMVNGGTVSDERICGNLGGATECTCYTEGGA